MSTASQPWPGLGPQQQKLLLAALASNKKRRAEATRPSNVPSMNGSSATNDKNSSTSNGINPSLFPDSSDLFAMNSIASPAFDLGASDPSFDANFSKTFGDLNDSFPSLDNGDTEGEHGEQGEKRKNPDEDSDDASEQSDEKRRDSEPKEAKKPGRKLLTSEPTTKRKAQNRAAQRAFRERKEKHLKDLETKVADLEKASESANHENSVLRAQVERLQDQLKDYRRRMSLNNTNYNNSPPSTRTSLDNDRSLGPSSLDFNFNFDFPKFGGVPGSVLPSTQAVGKPQKQQSSSPFTSYDSNSFNGLASHQNSASSISNDSPQSQTTNQSPFGGPMFGAGFFDPMSGSTTMSPQPMTNSLAGSLGDANGKSPAYSNSSSARSPASHNGNGPSSSCCTSPDPVDWTNIHNNYQKNSVDQNSQSGTNTTPGLTNAKTPNSENLSLDFLANQNGGSFDPVLFNDYRDTQNAIVGDESFSGGFFEEGLSFPDFNDPFNFNLSTDSTNPAEAPGGYGLKQLQQAHAPNKKSNLLEQVTKQRDGNYEDQSDNNLVIPSSTEDYSKSAPNLMTCHKIWNQLQNCPRFKSGDFDVDSLCSELSAKAKCTETGVAVPTEVVEAALWKLAGEPSKTAQQQPAQPQKSFDQSSDVKLDAKAEATRRFEQFMAGH